VGGRIFLKSNKQIATVSVGERRDLLRIPIGFAGLSLVLDEPAFRDMDEAGKVARTESVKLGVPERFVRHV